VNVIARLPHLGDQASYRPEHSARLTHAAPNQRLCSGFS
jgi:hypothetical protein